MNKKLALFSALLLFLSFLNYPMEQEQPNKRQKTEVEDISAEFKKLTLRDACLSYIQKNNAHEPTIQNDTMALLQDASIDDEHDPLKGDVIQQLQSPFIFEYQTNLIKLIEQDLLSCKNQQLLVEKFCEAFKTDQKVLVELILKNTDISFEKACVFFLKNTDLQTTDGIKTLASRGTINPEIAEIAAELLKPSDLDLIVDEDLYDNQMIEGKNKEYFQQAHYKKLLDQIHNKLIICAVHQSSGQDKEYVINNEYLPLQILLEEDTATVINDQSEALFSYDTAMNFRDIDMTTCVAINQQYAALLLCNDNNNENILDIVLLPQHGSMATRIVSLSFPCDAELNNLHWSADNKRLILSNSEESIFYSIEIPEPLVYNNGSLKLLLAMRLSPVLEDNFLVSYDAWITESQERISELYNLEQLCSLSDQEKKEQIKNMCYIISATQQILDNFLNQGIPFFVATKRDLEKESITIAQKRDDIKKELDTINEFIKKTNCQEEIIYIQQKRLQLEYILFEKFLKLEQLSQSKFKI